MKFKITTIGGLTDDNNSKFTATHISNIYECDYLTYEFFTNNRNLIKKIFLQHYNSVDFIEVDIAFPDRNLTIEKFDNNEWVLINYV